MVKIGVIGCGVIGGALIKWLENNNSDCKIFKVDPPKGFNDRLDDVNAIFISIHIPTEADGTQDLTLLGNIIQNCPDVPIYVRTTLLPGTCDMLSKKYNKQVNFMPEFLTERTAIEDFAKQPMVFTRNPELLRNIFIGKSYMEMTSLEAEITKYAHNVFGALKVTYFNGIYEYCQSVCADYNKVREGVLLSGYINEPHTSVPGPDGKLGYGGKCFPKDVNAFKGILKGYSLNKLISVLPELNDNYRESTVNVKKELVNA